MAETNSFNKKQIIVISLSFLVFLLLLFTNRTTIQSKNSRDKSEKTAPEAKSELQPIQDQQLKSRVTQLENKLKVQTLPSEKTKTLENLLALVNSARLIDWSVSYLSQIYEMNPTDENLARLAKMESECADLFQSDSASSAKYNQLALQHFQILSKKQPNNSQWVIESSVRKVKSNQSGLIMEGIQELVGVTQKDSLNFTANFQLGYFSLESNQPEKAVKRFQKCLHSQPENPDVLLGLAVAYEQLKDKQNAINYYKKVITVSKDEQVKAKVKEKIQLFTN